MANERDSATTPAEQAAWFTTTHWSIVLNARDPAWPQASQALEKLCRSYWYPLYTAIVEIVRKLRRIFNHGFHGCHG